MNRKNLIKTTIALLIASTSAKAAQTYVPSSIEEVSTTAVNLLSECTPLDFMFKDCVWASEYSIVPNNQVTVNTGFRESAGTAIILNGQFNKTGADFSLVVDGARYPILDIDGDQSFPLPTGTNNSIQIKVTSPYSGREYAETETTALIRSVKIKLDNTALIAGVLKGIDDLADKDTYAMKEYQRQKKFLGFFNRTDSEIGTLKEILTGRSASDLSGNCKSPTLLLPDECQTLTSFNNYLKGDKSEFTTKTKDDSFEALKTANENLGGSITFLKAAKVDIKASITELFENASTLIISK